MTGYTEGQILSSDAQGRVTESRTYQFDGETWDGTKFSDLPSHYSWEYTDNGINEKPIREFAVNGSIVDEVTNTRFSFRKGFDNYESAEFCYNLMISQYPKSFITLTMTAYQDLSKYHSG